jgi:hypothetical protein
VSTAGRRIANPPQVDNLPHKKFMAGQKIVAAREVMNG